MSNKDHYVHIYVNHYTGGWEGEPDDKIDFNESGYAEHIDVPYGFVENLNAKFDIAMMAWLDEDAKGHVKRLKRVRPGNEWTWMLIDECGNYAFYIAEHEAEHREWHESQINRHYGGAK